MGIHSLMHNAIHSSMTSSYFYGMAVVRKKNLDMKQTKWPVTTGRHKSNANIGTILSVSDQHLHATESAKSFSRLLFSSIDESFKGHGTAGEAFEDYEAARMVLTLPTKLSKMSRLIGSISKLLRSLKSV